MAVINAINLLCSSDWFFILGNLMDCDSLVYKTVCCVFSTSSCFIKHYSYRSTL